VNSAPLTLGRTATRSSATPDHRLVEFVAARPDPGRALDLGPGTGRTPSTSPRIVGTQRLSSLGLPGAHLIMVGFTRFLAATPVPGDQMHQYVSGPTATSSAAVPERTYWFDFTPG
jgi:hypothetical protein